MLNVLIYPNWISWESIVSQIGKSKNEKIIILSAENLSTEI